MLAPFWVPCRDICVTGQRRGANEMLAPECITRLAVSCRIYAPKAAESRSPCWAEHARNSRVVKPIGALLIRPLEFESRPLTISHHRPLNISKLDTQRNRPPVTRRPIHSLQLLLSTSLISFRYTGSCAPAVNDRERTEARRVLVNKTRPTEAAYLDVCPANWPLYPRSDVPSVCSKIS
jgi:hypothetical protein